MLDVKKVKYHPSPNLRIATTRWFEKRLIYKGKSYPVKNLLLIAAALLLIVFLAVYFLIARIRDNQADPNLAIQKETKDLTDRIGTFMELPAGEQPTLATVTDQDKAQGAGFFCACSKRGQTSGLSQSQKSHSLSAFHRKSH